MTETLNARPTVRLEVREVDVAYGETTVVDNVSFVLETGTIGCLLGPSGCGKTTLLRAIAGFEPVSQGEILIRGTARGSAGLDAATGAPPYWDGLSGFCPLSRTFQWRATSVSDCAQ